MSTTATATPTNIDRLGSLIGRLEQEKSWKRDLIVPAPRLEYRPDGRLYITEGPGANFSGKGNTVTDICHSHMSEKLVIPTSYYKRMLKDQPELLATNINTWLQRAKETNYMLRTFQFDPEQGGLARAFLSDKYAALDNYDVLFAALEAIKDMKVNVTIDKAEVTDRRLYLHVTCPEIEVNAESFLRGYLANQPESAAGYGIVTGFVMTNSEVGLGSYEIRPRAKIIVCNNGMMVSDDSFRKVHAGAQLKEGEIVWSDATRQKNYDLIISQTKDAIKTFLSEKHLNGMIQKLAAAHEIKLDNPIDCVHHVCRELEISEAHKKSILDYFINDGDTRASGVFQAVTRQAQNMSADEQFAAELGIGRMLPNIKGFDRPFSKS